MILNMKAIKKQEKDRKNPLTELQLFAFSTSVIFSGTRFRRAVANSASCTKHQSLHLQHCYRLGSWNLHGWFVCIIDVLHKSGQGICFCRHSIVPFYFSLGDMCKLCRASF